MNETQEFRRPFSVNSSVPSVFEFITAIIICYRGKQNLGTGDTFMDKDPSEFTNIQLTAGKLLNHKMFPR